MLMDDPIRSFLVDLGGATLESDRSVDPDR